MKSRAISFRKPGAIVTHGDAEINPLQFVNSIAEAAVAEGLEIHEQTDIVSHETIPSGLHRLRTSDGYEIEAEHVVYAVGYEPEELRGQLIKADINRSYALVTGVQSNLESWHDRYLIWETARPYLYMRTTIDGRVVIGGLDEEIEQPLHSALGRRKHSEKLLEQLQALFPSSRPKSNSNGALPSANHVTACPLSVRTLLGKTFITASAMAATVPYTA